MGKSNKNSLSVKNASREIKQSLPKIKTRSIEKVAAKTENKQNIITLPTDFDPEIVYTPRFGLAQLIYTTNKARISSKPPRPLNSYFLLKKCLLLELWERELKPTMPATCILARELWANAPSEAKKIYEELANQAQAWHQKTYPNYVFKPKKKAQCKNKPFPEGNSSGMLTTFALEPRPLSTPTFISETETTEDEFSKIFEPYETFESVSTVAVATKESFAYPPTFPTDPVDLLDFKFRKMRLDSQGSLLGEKNIDKLHNVFLTELPPVLNIFNCLNSTSNDIDFHNELSVSQFNYPDIESVFLGVSDGNEFNTGGT
ncbi:2489_t:CDS:1 [Ambispora gerdemannii]|uniref:2489_t:CDS:1 n=1 Tax=Ambispora gerdemannii TaxID=144530 RepID=A0A9N9C1M0_9GLOM|nr:2489_t:CDS:1 [Ambispora gerdemannii]